MDLSLNYSQFLRGWQAGKHQILQTTFIQDTETPVSAMIKLGEARPYSFLLESIEGGAIRGRYSILGRDPDLVWKCSRSGEVMVNRQANKPDSKYEQVKEDPLHSLRTLLKACSLDLSDTTLPMAAGLFGYLGYEMVNYMENLPSPKETGPDVPMALLVRPTLLAIFDQIDTTFTLVSPLWFDPIMDPKSIYNSAVERLGRALEDLNQTIMPEPIQKATSGSKPPPPKANMTEADYCGHVDRAKEYIRAGDVFQVVLSQRFTVPFQAPAFQLYRSIRRHDPSPFLFYFNFEDFSIVGSSPEILVRVRDNKITIRPLAGTRARGQGNRTDQELAEELLADPKELAEHLMLLDLGRNDVGRFAKIGSVKVTARNTIEYYKHVMHIVSNVEGVLDDRYTSLDAMIGGFPAGTVSGAPKIRAMEIIHELEPDRRGVYGGCVGYFGANGTLDTCLAIRTAIIKNNELTVQAGAGIVFDSNPQSEYRECLSKARGILSAAENI